MSNMTNTFDGLELISKLRKTSGYPIYDCKVALENSNWNLQNALEYLKELRVDKKYSTPIPITQNSVANGRIHSYIHHNGRVGVLLEIQCNTDFTARTEEFKELCDNICMQIAATSPICISPEKYYKQRTCQVATQKDVLRRKLIQQKKPENMIEQIIDNMISKKINERCLISQSFVMNQKTTIGNLIAELQKTTKENIDIIKFVRFELGI